eukprot:GILK01004905.1.p1 GENE.GILK01004905.1~~GILK01004905.1.p1  ORF type:complete len:262 (-),score=33.38 GILK01004905.1:91-876(-)
MASDPKLSSALEYGYAEEVNGRFRFAMEDDHVVVDKFGGDPNQGLFCLYDGHGGRQAVDYCVAKFHEVLLEHFESSSYQSVENSLEEAFLKVDEQLKLTGSWNAGTTSVVCVLRNEGADRCLYVANVGDSRAVLSRADSAVRLSYDDKGTDPAEIDRVKQAGGVLIRSRVAGQLAVTRALGDHALKSEGVIAVPHVTRHVLTPSDTFMVLASDGLWDVIQDQECVDLVKEMTDAKQMAESLVKAAIQKGSRDNVSVLVIRF